MWVPEGSLFRSQAAQRVLENTASQSSRISAAVGGGDLVAKNVVWRAAVFCHSGASMNRYMCQHHLLYISKMMSQSTYRLQNTLSQIQNSLSLSGLEKCCGPSLSAQNRGSSRRTVPGAAAEKAVAGRWQSRWVMVLQAGCLQAGKGHLGHSAL